MSEEYRRVAEDDPRRCQAITANGQCQMVAMEDQKCCKVHGGAANQLNIEKEKIRNYQLSKWQGQVNQMTDSEGIKSLRNEIGILRMTLTAILDKCSDQNDLLMYSNKISDMATKIEKVVSSCHRLEASTGQLLDKTTALNFAAQVVEIVGRHINDPDTLDRVSNEIMLAIGGLNK